VLASNGVLASDTIAPILCESCAQIGLFIDGTVRQATPQELIWIEKSPAFKDVIEPARQAIHREIISGGVRAGQQKGYVVLSNTERAKGFVRPYRDSYIHKPCGSLTTMGRTIAETYARDPGFYSGTFCCGCGHHFPLEQFVWDGTDQQVGS
jgi:hypothetical protein